MHLLLAPDKFKGSLTASEVMDALSMGISKAIPEAIFTRVHASDGGDGFLEAVSQNIETCEIQITTVDPLGRDIQATYLMTADGNDAYIEMARASGLELLKNSERSALKTSTYGTGLLIKDAIRKGAHNVYIGLGGSATNDGGIGVAAALGYHFLDEEGKTIYPSGENLQRIKDIRKPDLKGFENISIFAVNDVNNPLFGNKGAALVYGPQKGADKGGVAQLDKGLENLHLVVKSVLGKDVANLPGAGAAGGVAYGLKSFLGASFISGTQFILELARIPQLLENGKVDYLITGEGKIDSQTLSGKLIHGIIEVAKDYQIPVLAVCGKLEEDRKILLEAGLTDILEIRDPQQTLAYNMAQAAQLIEFAVFQYFSK